MNMLFNDVQFVKMR